MACEAANEVVVAENGRTVSMRARKSLIERVMYCHGCAEVLGPAISDRAVGPKALEGQRASESEELMLELLVLWSEELKRLEGILVKLGLEDPQCAQL